MSECISSHDKRDSPLSLSEIHSYSTCSDCRAGVGQHCDNAETASYLPNHMPSTDYPAVELVAEVIPGNDIECISAWTIHQLVEHCAPPVETIKTERPQVLREGKRHRIKYLFSRYLGLLDIPQVLVFDIILYLADVGSDIMAAVNHYQEDHPICGSLTVTFVVLPAVCWAAVSWTWWYDARVRDQRKAYRRFRMLLAVLLLDPLFGYSMLLSKRVLFISIFYAQHKFFFRSEAFYWLYSGP